MPSPLQIEGRKPIAWPDRTHRTLAEVWGLTAEEVIAERKPK
jgi:hypothetical protein